LTISNIYLKLDPVPVNLNWRQNNKHTDLREDFQYDNPDRLTNVQHDTKGLSMTYDGNTGDLLSESYAGTLNYILNPQTYRIDK
jgi:hypothetical protein